MNGLLPIIRRVRRPLLPPDAATDARPAAAAVKVQVTPAVAVPSVKAVESRGWRQVGPDKANDAKSTSALEA